MRAQKQMDSSQVGIIEDRCQVMTFEDSTADVVHLRPLIRAWPSKIIAARIDFDHVTQMSLKKMTPLQLIRISKLKSELITTLQSF